MTEYQLAMEKVAKAAMGDLIGCSEPPEGVADNYPFNAPKWAESLPEEWRKDAHDIVAYVPVPLEPN